MMGSQAHELQSQAPLGLTLGIMQEVIQQNGAPIRKLFSRTGKAIKEKKKTSRNFNSMSLFTVKSRLTLCDSVACPCCAEAEVRGRWNSCHLSVVILTVYFRLGLFVSHVQPALLELPTKTPA